MPLINAVAPRDDGNPREIRIDRSTAITMVAAQVDLTYEHVVGIGATVVDTPCLKFMCPDPVHSQAVLTIELSAGGRCSLHIDLEALPLLAAMASKLAWQRCPDALAQAIEVMDGTIAMERDGEGNAIFHWPDGRDTEGVAEEFIEAIEQVANGEEPGGKDDE